MLLRRLKPVLSPGLYDALRRVRFEWKCDRLHRSSLAKIRKDFAFTTRDLQLHIGCGGRRRKDWVNIDLLHPEADYHLDLRRPLPWPDNCVKAIYSEHFIEHLEIRGELERFLTQS